MRTTILRSCTLTFALLLCASSLPAAAQVLPIPRQPDWERERQMYTAEALKGFNELLNQWREAVNQDDLRTALRLYTDHPTLHILNGAPVAGRAEVEGSLREMLPRISQLQTGVQDFAASDRLAYAVGRFWYQLESAGSSTQSVSGTYVMVAERHGRQWRIRTQVFKNDEPA